MIATWQVCLIFCEPYDVHGTLFDCCRRRNQLSQIKSSIFVHESNQISRIWTIHSMKMTTTSHHLNARARTLQEIEYYDGNDYSNNFQCCHRCIYLCPVRCISIFKRRWNSTKETKKNERIFISKYLCMQSLQHKPNIGKNVRLYNKGNHVDAIAKICCSHNFPSVCYIILYYCT